MPLKQTLKEIFDRPARGYDDMLAIREAIDAAGLGAGLICGHVATDTMESLESLIERTNDAGTKDLAEKLHALIKAERFLTP